MPYDRNATEILDELRERGAMPTEIEVETLCGLAIAAEDLADKWQAFDRALAKAGWSIVDMTNDDDGPLFELVPPETEPGA